MLLKKNTLQRVYISTVLLTGFLLHACNRKLDYALELAGENRNELIKVLEYFKDDPDTIKYSAAKFLIENMPYHYSYVGKGMDTYDSVYMIMSKEAKQLREKTFNTQVQAVDWEEIRTLRDIKGINAEQLIKVVEKACQIWQNVPWKKDYDICTFYDYVLPYRVFNEQISNWHEVIDREYPYLTLNTVWSKRGPWKEAEQAAIHNAREVSFGNAYNRKAVMLDNPLAKVTFDVYSPLSAKKNLYLRYSSIATDNIVSVSVNEETEDTLYLDPTKAMTVFRSNRTGLEISLKKGKNQITVQYGNGTVGLDYMQLTAIEDFDTTTIEDFTASYCRIVNKKTGNCITFDTERKTLPADIRLKAFETTTNHSALLRIDYHGYACWSISSFCNGNNGVCLTTDGWFVKEKAPVIQSKYQNGTHQKWVLIPVGNGYYRIMGKDSGLFLESTMSADGIEMLVQASYSGQESQHWKIDRMEKKNGYNSCTQESAMARALKIADVMPQFEWFSFPGIFSPKASSLCRGRTGNCSEEAAYTVYLCRYMGIPSAVDFTPHWGNHNLGHLWTVLLKPDGTSIPFYMGRTPGDSTHEYHNYAKPKVFRYRFQLNHAMAEDMKEETDIPVMFQIPNFTDVTNEYSFPTDITRDVPEEFSDKKIAYICVFDNLDWQPVFYGKVSGGKVTFKSMGRDIVYMAAFCKEGRMIPFGCPFRVDKNSTIHNIEANESHKQRLHLLRKHPFLRINDRINNFMAGGKFQGSNKADFSDATTLHVHQGKTTGNWYDIRIDDRRRYKYLRYIGPNGGYCNINEMEFYDTKNRMIEGEIIGTKGEIEMDRENVFDKDILTTFQGLDRSNQWVGIKSHHPVQIGRIRYIGRNDGNCIEIGDTYKLCYWQNNEWKSLDSQIAQSDTLIYDAVPDGALYILHNLTKGKEERPFTYENGKQVWW